jgi:hypothetical protein
MSQSRAAESKGAPEWAEKCIVQVKKFDLLHSTYFKLLSQDQGNSINN